MPDLAARMRALLVAVAVATLVVGVLAPATAAAKDPPNIGRFMEAIGHVESGGRYDARNPVSGAYGKYQILPSNWRAWARQYLGNAYAPQTPRNQERVARAKFSGLYRWLDSWRQVSYWWLTGRDGRGRTWSSTARRYVQKVMDRYAAGPRTQSRSTAKVIADSSKAIDWSGSWGIARHGGYQGGKAHFATRAGATATITVTARAVSWVGPVGPTRGKARIYVDGTAVATVDLRASRFRARQTVWSKRWSTRGTHTIVIEVLGTRGRPYVAIDSFVVRP